MTGYKRLHITPLTPDKLSSVLTPELLPLAKNISYHTIATFPEKAYGYVELPNIQAERLRKQRHGLIFKGMKLRVEEARPETRKRRADENDIQEEVEKRPRREKKPKEKKGEGVIGGVELREGRKVKRGWRKPGENKSKKESKAKNRTSASRTSSSVEKSECLFKTKLPPNAPATGERRASSKKSKKPTDGETVVQEFAKTTKAPSFLRDDAPINGHKVTTEFVEGKGWVAEDGSIVEAAPRSKRPKNQHTEAETTSKLNITVTRPSTRSSTAATKKPVVSSSSDEDDSSSSDSSSSPSASDDEAQNHTRMASLSLTRSSPSPPPASSPTAPAPHPLETLFKRPALKSTPPTTSAPTSSKSKNKPPPLKPSLEVSTSFTFFGPDGEDAQGAEDAPNSTKEGLKVPQTPFTRQDFRDRTLRSAAPTPDTAAPHKSGFGAIWGSQSPSVSDIDEAGPNTEDIDLDGENGKAAQATPGSKEAGEEKPAERSEFEKWFWEHRGETNRHWKQMRREALKEKRRDANKRRTAR